jgi:phosphoglycerate-specific signal transduction histidine kinase
MSNTFFENMWKRLYKEQKWEGEIKNIDKNGNSYWVKGIIFPKYDIRNELIGYTSIRVNITDAKQLKKINNLLKEDLSNKLNEIKMRDESLENTTKIVLMGKILDSLSHQWKKPMSTISIELANFKARIVNNELDTLELQKIHDEIAYQLKSLSITLNEFKTFFSHSNQNDKYNVKSALDEAILVVKPECDLHHIEVLLDAKEAIYCYGVFNELKQIMINLLKNSIEHLIANNIKTPYIKFGIIENEGSVIIECIDNVQGASKQIIEKVFSNNYDEQVLKDAGLNLYIAKLLLEKIGAKVRFEIKKEYSRFVIELVSKDRRKDKRE